MEVILPNRRNTNFAPLSDKDEFEDLVRDLCALEWEDPNTERFGRSGQRQYGVDIYGLPIENSGIYRAAQCKLKKYNDPLTEEEILSDYNEAATHFPHELDNLIIATSGLRDTNTQILVDKINSTLAQENRFGIKVWFWENITERLARYPRLILKFYKDYYASLTTLMIAEELVDKPLRLMAIALNSSNSFEKLLCLRGLYISRKIQLPSLAQTEQLDEPLPDGVLCDVGSAEKASLLKIASNLSAVMQHADAECPVVIVIPEEMSDEFGSHLVAVGGDPNRALWLFSETPHHKLADTIFGEVFVYGYQRRGGLPTIDVLARTMDTRSSALLDLNWKTDNFPTLEQWEEYYRPALSCISRQFAALGDRVTVQVDSRLFIPIAVALGFFLNLRTTYLALWTRRSGSSNYRQQLWLSDGDVLNESYATNWYLRPNDEPFSAIIELTSYHPIHKEVERFAAVEGLAPDIWLEISLQGQQAISNIDEGYALAYANQVARQLRELKGWGVSEFYLFASMPSPLAVLVGQRLVACGRIHLYWYTNPSYQYAFTLE